MVCEKCGFELKDDAVFCPGCGAKVQQQSSDPDEEKTVIYGFSRDSKDPEKKDSENSVPLSEEKEIIDTNPSSEKSGQDKEADMHKDDNNDSSDESIFCHECGAKNSPDDRFCHVCGKPLGSGGNPHEPEKVFCHSCGTANDPGDMFCINCGTPLRKSEKNQNKAGTGVSPNIPFKGIIGIAAAVLVIIALVFVVKGIFSGAGSTSETLIYIKDNDLMQYGQKENNKIDDGIIDRDDDTYNMDVSYVVKMSDDESKLYYPTDYEGLSYDLCVKDMRKKSDEGTKIDSDVVYYSLLGNDKVVYIKDSSDRKLYLSDLKGNKTKIDSEVESFWLSEDEKKLLWKTDSTDDNRLYYIDTNLKNDKIKIDSEITQFIVNNDDFSKVYYMKDDALYEVSGLEDKNKIDSDILGCWANKEDNNIVVYYSVNNEDGKMAELLIDDDKADEDAAMKEPNISDYQHKETKDSFWGPQEQVVTDDAYYKDMEEYDKKLERDRVRDSLDNESLNSEAGMMLSYYSYTPGEEPVKLSSDYSLADEQSDIGFLYSSVNPEKIEKVKLSKLMESQMSNEAQKKVINALKSGMEAHLNVFGKDIKLDIDLEDSTPISAYCDTKNKTAYICVSDKGIVDASTEDTEKSLYKLDYSKDNGELEKVCDEYDGYSVRVIDGTLYYICERDKNGSGDLYAKGERISSDVYTFTSIDEDKGVLFWTDRDDSGVGTLNVYKGKNTEKISDDVYTAKSNSKGEIAFLTDYSFKKYRGDLKYYKNGKILNVDTDVNSIAYFD